MSMEDIYMANYGHEQYDRDTLEKIAHEEILHQEAMEKVASNLNAKGRIMARGYFSEMEKWAQGDRELMGEFLNTVYALAGSRR